MKKLSILLINFISTLLLGALIVALFYILIPATHGMGFAFYFFIINLINLFISGFIHVLFYAPFIHFRSEEKNIHEESLTLYLFVIGFVFLLFTLMFGIITEGDWHNSANAIGITAAFSVLTAQGLGAYLLHKKLKKETL